MYGQIKQTTFCAKSSNLSPSGPNRFVDLNKFKKHENWNFLNKNQSTSQHANLEQTNALSIEVCFGRIRIKRIEAHEREALERERGIEECERENCAIWQWEREIEHLIREQNEIGVALWRQNAPEVWVVWLFRRRR